MSRLFNWLNNEIFNRLNENSFLFKLIISLIVINFVAFLGLARINPLELINPFHFVEGKANDSRKKMKLFFPRSLLNEKSELALSTDKFVVAVEQSVTQVNQCDTYFKTKVVTCNARLILHELILGPADDQVLVKRFLKDRTLIKAIQFYKGKLVIDLNQNLWKRKSAQEKKVIKYSFKNSILQNLPEVKDIFFNLI